MSRMGVVMSRASATIPSVDEVLRGDTGQVVVRRYGRMAAVGAIRTALDELRAIRRACMDAEQTPPSRTESVQAVALTAATMLEAADAPRLKRVMNLTGTVLHTNLGRAILAEEAIAAATEAMRFPAALEFDVESGRRGERDDAVRGLLCELTGAEHAIAVNNNAAAVMLVLNALAGGKDTIVSRGELIEIGGAFRMPDIMARAGTRLKEVGTTNRTHLKDYKSAIGPETGLLMKVHTSNYLVQGFTKEVDTAELAVLGRETGVPVVDDLGSGTLIDLSRYGLRRERTVQDAVRDGADIVTFSGDKLLGGPQAGFIVGRRDLVEACASNPMKRAMRLDKVRLAALEATLRLYRDPDRLMERLPTLRLLTRSREEVEAVAGRLAPTLRLALGPLYAVTPRDCASQIGSGALPLETIPSAGIAITPAPGISVEALSSAFRRLPVPVIGRIEKGALLLDLRCLDDEPAFVEQLFRLTRVLSDAGAVR